MKSLLLASLLLFPQIYPFVPPAEDIPPITYTTPASRPCNQPSPTDGNVVYAVCVTGPETHTTCQDKTRFLIYSEDGVGHCLRLGKESSNYFIIEPAIPSQYAPNPDIKIIDKD